MAKSLFLLIFFLLAASNLVTSKPMPGGWSPIKNLKDQHVKDLGVFAVSKHGEVTKDSLVFVQVVKGDQQVVSGMNYRLVLEAKDEKEVVAKYLAVVWEQPWRSAALSSFLIYHFHNSEIRFFPPSLSTKIYKMATTLINSLLSLATNLLPSIAASAYAPSSSSNSKRARAVEEDLERLMRTLEWIKATLYDAEEREIRYCSVKLWLKELRKVAYDAEDVLSEYRYEVIRVQVEARKAQRVPYIVPIPDGIVDRLNKIRSRFDEIAKDREALQLRESDGARRPDNKLLRPPTGHMVDEASIFGRDAEIEEVINLLLSEKEKPFSVISIIGKGGLGKTTIAQLVYKDEGVSRCFDLKGWVCVSEEFDVGRLTKAIIESVTENNYDLSELSQLQEKLAKTVKGNTILLVLDDVWNENRNLWELFRVPFKEARMVRILVTTRNEKVAKVMETTCFDTSNLSEYSCWQLFEHYAFSGTSYTMPKHLVDMGREIIRKCGGLPLAVKLIASLLRHETDEEVWREILESGLWEIKESKEEIFPALQISYAHLPAHLKPCFLFCSMYPKDYMLRKMDLIRLWIAHGYIESRRNREITEIGVEYYNELKERSFLDDADVYPKEDYSKLHDIIHDLARLNSKNEHYSVEINQPLDIQERTVLREVYHLYVGGSMLLGHVNRIPQENMKGLRTIIIEMEKWEEYFDPNLELMDDCQDSSEGVTLCNLTKFEVLRVLILKWDSLTKIPNSISELKHLTYLCISSTRLKMLPLSIGLLYNLLALQVHCYSLEYLPENIGDLANLQFLYIFSAGNLKEIPKSLSSLTNLLELTIDGRFLDYVPHGLVNFPSITKVQACWKVRTIGWLKDMKDLKGMLCIEKLKNINNLEDAKRANLRNKCKLEILQLNWDYKDEIEWAMDSRLELNLVPEACEDGIIGTYDVHFSLLECLQPHPNLKILHVEGYPSAIVPGWMSDPLLLQSIQELMLSSCDYINFLPFGNLHTLKHLKIQACSSIRNLQLEMLPTQLEKLQILECDHLELITGLGNLDMLVELKIFSCEVLKSLTMDGLQLVESTELFGDLSHEIPLIGRQGISSLKRLEIEYCDLLHFLPAGIQCEPCYVSVRGCGMPDLSILPSSIGHTMDEASTFGRGAEKMEVIDFLPSEKEKSISVVSINDKVGLTGHMVDKATIFGRSDETMEVRNFLLSEREKSFSVISIVGKGGLGKTTIAQLVYRDLRASRCFDLFGWVCVSEGFDVRRLVKATIESISKINYGVSELNPLQEELVKIVKEKAILLVLDDVWNENQSLWQLFQVSFKEAKMVRILVTTRNRKVAKVMQARTCFSLTRLPEDSCWQLFQHYALSGTGHLVPTHLVVMGMEIMRKCGGVPLAVKLIASLLRHENEEVWRGILESDLWESNPSNDIFPALQISYAHLPTHLQRCFLFCSMYPKDYSIEKTKLIELWISHGYIEFGGKKRTTEIGVEYYEELKERSLLDDFCISECWELQQRYFLDDSSGQFSECCKLHDMIHDLARYNSEKEHSLVEINQPHDIQKGNILLEAHHLYVGGFMGYVNQTLLQNQQNLKGLRTLSMDLRGCSGDLEHQYCINNTKAMDLNLELSEYYEECSGEVTICNLIKFEALMVLELKAYNLTKIPDSISMLKHLVYLGIISPRLKMLPLSIGLLCNLQTLILDCFSLEYLPECIGNLANLQFLYIQSGAIKKLPKSLCSLSNLLRLVIRSDNLEEVPLDLKNLSNLYALTIRSNRIQALPNTIGCLTSLEELNLLSLGGSYDVLPDGKVDYVPHGSVNFPAIKTMAAWLRVGTLKWLKDMKDLEGKLSIGGLKNMSNLEDAQHANLINKCKLETLDLCWDPGYYISPYDAKSELRLSLIPEACKGGLVCADDAVSLLEYLQPHPNLKKLLVRWYPSATVPNWMRDPSSFRSIQEVLLECCANIQSLPFENFHSLKHLTIVACSSIRVLQLEQNGWNAVGVIY
ncbi:uncharacterized protein LOC144548344 [Carex rostrata]